LAFSNLVSIYAYANKDITSYQQQL